jgi:hypothetical protein
VSENNSGKAIASLIFGILGLTGACPCVGSILAIVLASGESGDIAKAGRILGWIGLALTLLSLLLVGGFLLLAAAAGGFH